MSVSNAGVTKSTKEEIRGLISSEFIKQWPDAQVNSNGPIGVIIAAMTESSYKINESLLQGYNQLFLETATGTFLDSIAAQNGITRIRERFATATITFTGRDGYLIPSGTLVRAPSNGVIFETTQSVQISIGTADVIAKATTAGDVGNVPTGSITALVSALPGVVSVNNAADAFGGGGTETDEELRLRIKTTINSYGSFPMLTRRLYDIPGVSSVDILENLTNVTSSEGLPPKSISILINGGENDQIGKCLYDYLPVGTQTHGDQKVDVINPFGRVVSYRFVRPLLKVINVNVTSAIEVSEAFKQEVQGAWSSYLKSQSGGRTITVDEFMISLPNSVITRYPDYFNNLNFNLTLKIFTNGNPEDSVTLQYNELPQLGAVQWT